MSVLPKLMEFVSLRKVCDAVDKEDIYTLQRGVEMAREVNKKLAPNQQIYIANQSKLDKAQELLDMKESVLKEEARLKELVAAREQLLLAHRRPEPIVKAKKTELDAIARFVSEYQRYRKTCPPLNHGHDLHCPNHHRCKNCAIDKESEEEDGPLFKKKRATPENPRGSLELHLSDKVYYYLVERDEMIVVDRECLTDDAKSTISCIETEILESLLSGSETLSVTETDSESTVCAASSITEFYPPSHSDSLNIEKLKELINESQKTDKRLNNCRRHVLEMCQRHRAEERFRQTTNELMNRYGIDKRSNQSRTNERFNHYKKNSNVFCPIHSPKSTRVSFDNSRRSARVVAPKKVLCENCVMKNLMGERRNLQRPCASTYSSRPTTPRPPTPWSATSNPRDLNTISSSFQQALWPKTSTRRRFY